MINDRLQEFMDKKGLTGKELAEMIDVQPSSISHILKGRNKPSLDLIQKLMLVFPDFDLKYFVTGKRMVGENEELAQESETQKQNVDSQKVIDKPARIDQVIVFYTDGTFETIKQHEES